MAILDSGVFLAIRVLDEKINVSNVLVIKFVKGIWVAFEDGRTTRHIVDKEDEYIDTENYYKQFKNFEYEDIMKNIGVILSIDKNVFEVKQLLDFDKKILNIRINFKDKTLSASDRFEIKRVISNNIEKFFENDEILINEKQLDKFQKELRECILYKDINKIEKVDVVRKTKMKL